MTKIVISLIHNNDEERLSIIRPKISELVMELKKKMDVEFCEVSWQSALTPVSLRLGLLRDFMYWKLNREWVRYKKSPSRFLLTDCLSFAKRTIKKYSDRATTEKWLRSCAIEMVLTNKHIGAFTNALENKSNYLLVFEDDAVFKKDSISNLVHLIDDLERDNKIPAYIDLAGGCQFDELEIDKLELKRDEEFRYYAKPVTNTACCYLVNQEQLKLFGYYLTRTPMLRYIGADWLISTLFMMQSKDAVLSHCRHADPHFFDHGSVMGNFQSCIR